MPSFFSLLLVSLPCLRFLSEIIGKSGASIRAIQDKLGVRITIPPTAAKDTTAMVKIGIAGDRENINRAKEVIREIMTYYHSPITHPGYVHVSLDIPQRMYNGIIGAKGGEIRHIQNNFKVAVHIPNPNSLTQHVIVVGEQSNQVDNAVRYIQKIVQQITTEEAKTATVVETWNEQSDLANTGEGEDPEPEWVSQYMYNREATKQVNLMAAVNVPISLSTAESNAWKMGDAADGW
jgi:polyribonucleotide nucleotidyltransferase